MGMAAIGVALWKYVMRYSPENPDFFNRDRFVLSNGGTCNIISYHLHRLISTQRSYMSLAVLIYAPGWVQKHDF